MTKIAELQDKGAVVAWSPLNEYADVVALGSKDKGGIGFEDNGGEIELYDLNITQNNHNDGLPEPTLLGRVKTATQFGSLAWGGKGGDPFGSVLAGGMLDGTVNLWRPSTLLAGGGAPEDALLASVLQHKGAAVSALKFSSDAGSVNLLATGGSTGQLWMMDIGASSTDSAVNVYSPNGDDANGCTVGGPVTQVAWNSQVAHILASSSANGSVVVWDLRQKKPWCELRVESGCPVSDVAWNPGQGLHMMTASDAGGSGSGGLKLWDLRASMSMPLTTLEGGHAGGTLSIDWCPHDDKLMVSCGNDNRTLLWDLYSLRPIAEIPSSDDDDAAVSSKQMQQNCGQNDFYGGSLGSSQQKRYGVSWSPCRRGVVSTCSFDRKVQAHSLIGLATKCGRAPKWMNPASGVSCGFGGAVVSISNSSTDTTQPPQRFVKIDTVVENPALVSTSERFESEFCAKDCILYCHDMAAQATDGYESQVWSFMQIMFETNAREELLGYLGFDPEKIQSAAMEFSEDGKEDNESALPFDDSSNAAAPTNGAVATPSTTISKQAEDTIKDALLVGNFEAAVECCFRCGNLADALVLASCGGADLWQKTQARYFAGEEQRRPFLSLVGAVVHDRLLEYVASSDPAGWRETLAVLSTYGKSEEFPQLCSALGKRLEGTEGAGGDSANASLCYMCAMNLSEAVKHWKVTLQSASGVSAGRTGDLLPLHDFIEKVTVFTQALDSGQVEFDNEISNLFADYSKALANQGLLVTAAKYLSGCDTQECRELRDRIYRSRMGSFCPALTASPPDFPYDFVNVGVASDLQGITVKQYSESQLIMQMQQLEQPFTQAAAADTTQTVTQIQSQSRQHQMQHQQVQQSPQLQPTQLEGASQSLLPGWVAVQDPNSGQWYYANQSTGESLWEPPVAASVPEPQPGVAASNSYLSQPSETTVQTQPSTMRKDVASKYGDGFVTSASNPQLAEQYGNVGTCNPYSNANRPGTAAAAVGNSSKKAPVSGTFNPDSMPALSEEYKYLQDGLVTIVEHLVATATGSMEKKQAAESAKAVAVFIKTLARGGVEADISHKVGSVVLALQNHDYGSASSIVTGLVSNEWKDHRDWLKGMKFLVQMASKKQI